MRKTIDRVCVGCGVTFSAFLSEVNRGKGKCCSLSCAASIAAINRDSTKENNPNWKGGVTGLEKSRKYRAKYPEKYEAHLILTKSIRNGTLTPMNCEICGSDKAEGHHDDYSKPMDVRWLCKTHHIEHHKNTGQI